MTGIDPASVEGDWRVAGEEEPDIGPVFTLRRGQVFSKGQAVGVYKLTPALLSFAETRGGSDDRIWTTRYTFALPGRAVDRLAGYWEQVARDDFDNEISVDGDCIFVRVA